MMNLIELEYKTSNKFKLFVDASVETMWAEAIQNDDIGDTWHSFWYRDRPYDFNIWTDDVTNVTYCSVYSCYYDEDNDICTDDSDFYRVKEEKILVH
tara:strand:+ start:209 stop:499 length:291 start_codon:yes stop_codon:yes gene_type:complete